MVIEWGMNVENAGQRALYILCRGKVVVAMTVL